jgi:hypothetical protein
MIKKCDIMTQRLIGLIVYYCRQSITHVLKAYLEGTNKLSVLGWE